MPEALEHSFDCGREAVGVKYIERQYEMIIRPLAGCADVFQHVFAPRAENESGPALGKRVTQRFADARRSARDPHDFVRE